MSVTQFQGARQGKARQRRRSSGSSSINSSGSSSINSGSGSLCKPRAQSFNARGGYYTANWVMSPAQQAQQPTLYRLSVGSTSASRSSMPSAVQEDSVQGQHSAGGHRLKRLDREDL